MLRSALNLATRVGRICYYYFNRRNNGLFLAIWLFTQRRVVLFLYLQRRASLLVLPPPRRIDTVLVIAPPALKPYILEIQPPARLQLTTVPDRHTPTGQFPLPKGKHHGSIPLLPLLPEEQIQRIIYSR